MPNSPKRERHLKSHKGRESDKEMNDTVEKENNNVTLLDINLWQYIKSRIHYHDIMYFNEKFTHPTFLQNVLQ